MAAELQALGVMHDNGSATVLDPAVPAMGYDGDAGPGGGSNSGSSAGTGELLRGFVARRHEPSDGETGRGAAQWRFGHVHRPSTIADPQSLAPGPDGRTVASAAGGLFCRVHLCPPARRLVPTNGCATARSSLDVHGVPRHPADGPPGGGGCLRAGGRTYVKIVAGDHRDGHRVTTDVGVSIVDTHAGRVLV